MRLHSFRGRFRFAKPLKQPSYGAAELKSHSWRVGSLAGRYHAFDGESESTQSGSETVINRRIEKVKRS